jgi:hypothetical protein
MIIYYINRISFEQFTKSFTSDEYGKAIDMDI